MGTLAAGQLTNEICFTNGLGGFRNRGDMGTHRYHQESRLLSMGITNGTTPVSAGAYVAHAAARSTRTISEAVMEFIFTPVY
jgi:hypothetical protein